MNWHIPEDISLELPYLYLIEIAAPGRTHRYVGKANGRSGRIKAYAANVQRIFAGLPRRVTPGQERYRKVHLYLAAAQLHGWPIRCQVVQQVLDEPVTQAEQRLMRELGCDLNGRGSWRVEDFEQLAAGLAT